MSVFDVIPWLRAKTLPTLPPLHINEQGWLDGEGVTIIASHPSWYYPKLSTASGDPTAIVAHCSATNPGTAINMAKRRAVPRTPKDRPASWHASVEFDSIVQMAPFHVGCWHAVGSIKGIGPANRTAVGIELIGHEQGPWGEGYVTNAMRLWRALVQSYGIKRSVAMVPHAVIDPKRRSDPGKDWMRNHAGRVLDYAYGL